MQNKTQIKQKSYRRANGFRQCFAVFVSLILLVAHSLPVAAGFGGNAPSGWIEICGGGGSYLVQMDEGSPYDTTEHEADCTHCPFCLVPFNTSFGSLPVDLNTLTPIGFTKITFSAAQTVQPAAPEQYWSACRGPPIANIENNMTTHSLPALMLAQAVSNTWSTPCS